MAEGLDGERRERHFGRPGEQRIAKLSEDDHHDAPDAIGGDHGKGSGKEQSTAAASALSFGCGAGQRIDRIFESKRRQDGDDLGKDEAKEREHDPELEIETAGWPRYGSTAFRVAICSPLPRCAAPG